MWRGNPERSPGPGPEVDGGAASEGAVAQWCMKPCGRLASRLSARTFGYVGKRMKNVLVNLGIIGFIGLP